MDVSSVLANTFSADATIRNAAEQQLTQAAETNFSGYLVTLVQELANEEAQGPVRAAAGIALKNAFTAREYALLHDLQKKWIQLDPDTKKRVKDLTLQALATQNSQAGQAAAQVVASIAGIELPQDQWPELMPSLVRNVGEGGDHLKQSSLTTIGFICESQDTDLRSSLVQHSNAILTAVVQGARKEEPNPEVRLAAIYALGDSLEFVDSNFKNEGERNYIMQVVCEATQAPDSRIQQGAFGCLNRIMSLYYDLMRFYMEKALFGLTIMGMKSDEEDVSKLAVEFWSTVCEEEIAIEDDNAQVERTDQMRHVFHFCQVATNEVVPVLLMLLTKQDEDAADDEYNISRAAYQCLQLYAQAVGGAVIQPVLSFVEANLRSEDWHHRDAAVSAFGAIMEGPDDKTIEPIVKQALPVIINMMDDKVIHVKDSTAYALGRITEACSEAIDPAIHLPKLIASLFEGLISSPKMAGSCCWALMNLAERFSGEIGCQENPLTPHFNESITRLLQVTERPDADNQLRTAAYEVLNTFVQNAANDSLSAVGSLSNVIIKRLEDTIPLQTQVVSVEDKLTLEEMQTSLCTVLLAIIQRLEKEITPQADHIMTVLLQLLTTAGPKSSVPDAVFATVSSLANALEEGFTQYMEAFSPFLYNALGNQEEPALCSMAIGLVSDITRSLGPLCQPYCDAFMNYLLNNLRSTALANQFKPAILQCFGDIAGAIGGHFETYLSVVAQVLQQAAGVQASPDGSYEMFDYVISLREGIVDAWGGIIGAMKAGEKTALLSPYVESIFSLLNIVYLDPNRSDALMRSSMGVIGDLADSFPNGEFSAFYRADWLTAMIKETRQNREFQARTIDTARWAREQVKRQIGGTQGIQQT
ncbi:Importin beta-1 subunit [Venustampulla echinocandica]|uniref:Importin-95 n=1 Tax=Venustampulla echinocandica TaxID=2656787 RepID=A0A370TZZ6_9HELO|nr:Importin beta-1 subunit [Venustampulla echinocandica]RDL41093.1 Importin beta-1 subunit [Venustampulla echinocandica]